MRYRCINDFLKRFLGLDLFIEDSKRHILEVNDECLLVVEHNFLFDYAKDKLLLVLNLVLKVNVLLCPLNRARIFIFDQVFSNVLFLNIVFVLGS